MIGPGPDPDPAEPGRTRGATTGGASTDPGLTAVRGRGPDPEDTGIGTGVFGRGWLGLVFL